MTRLLGDRFLTLVTFLNTLCRFIILILLSIIKQLLKVETINI